MRKEIKPTQLHYGLSEEDQVLSGTYLYQVLHGMLTECLDDLVSCKPSRLQQTWHDSGVLDQGDWFYSDLTENASSVLSSIQANCVPKAAFQQRLDCLLSSGEPNGSTQSTTFQGPIVLPGLDLTSLTSCVFEVYLSLTFKSSGMAFSPDQVDEILCLLTSSQPHTANSLLTAIQSVFVSPKSLANPDPLVTSYVTVASLLACVVQKTSLEKGTYSTLADNLGPENFNGPTEAASFYNRISSVLKQSFQEEDLFGEDEEDSDDPPGATLMYSQSFLKAGATETFDTPLSPAPFVSSQPEDTEVKPTFTLVTSDTPDLKAFSTLNQDLTKKVKND